MSWGSYWTSYHPEAWNLIPHVACGWAFDAGMREAERDAERAYFFRSPADMKDAAVAVAAERARCLAWVDWLACNKAVAYEWSTHEMEEYPNGRMFTGIRSGAPAPREG